MDNRKVTVLGGGNTAFSVAARLSHRGHRVCLLEHPNFADVVEPLLEKKVISLEGVLENGPVSIEKVTLDPQEALEFSDLLLLIVPAYAHKPFAELCGPFVKEEHITVIMPGTMGSLEWKRIVSEFGAQNITVGEVDTAPYVCRKTSSLSAVIWGEVSTLGLGVHPFSATAKVEDVMASLFSNVSSYKDVVECGLSAMNPVVHPAGVLMNAGRVEYSRGEFYFYEEGVSVSVSKVIEQVDTERRDIGHVLGYNLVSVSAAFHQAGFGPQGTIWEAINGSHMLTRLKAPGSLESRWLTEDIPYGIGLWSKLGRQYGVISPVMDSLVNLGSVVMESDGWNEGRSLEDLGIANLNEKELKKYLDSGE